jgi:hypothetical protein
MLEIEMEIEMEIVIKMSYTPTPMVTALNPIILIMSTDDPHGEMMTTGTDTVTVKVIDAGEEMKLIKKSILIKITITMKTVQINTIMTKIVQSMITNRLEIGF